MEKGTEALKNSKLWERWSVENPKVKVCGRKNERGKKRAKIMGETVTDTGTVGQRERWRQWAGGEKKEKKDEDGEKHWGKQALEKI